MNGIGVWSFFNNVIPKQINELLTKNNLSKSDIDLFIFHQASKMTLDSLIKSLKLPQEKVFTNLSNVGNTVSASIPIAMKDAIDCKKLKRGDMVLLCGFGVGLSWGTVVLKF